MASVLPPALDHDPRPRTYAEFWPFYLAQHRRPQTRALHHLGSALGLGLLAAGIAMADWRLLLAASIAGYALAWIGHVALERNLPATFAYPTWSFISDYRMFALWVSRRLGSELKKYDLS
jgi:hypothetical protein